MKPNQKVAKQERIEKIMKAAMRLARKHGYQHVTRDNIAKEAGVTAGLVSARWGTMEQIKRAIMREAVKTDDVVIIMQGLAARDRQAQKASEEIKKQAQALLVYTA